MLDNVRTLQDSVDSTDVSDSLFSPAQAYALKRHPGYMSRGEGWEHGITAALNYAGATFGQRAHIGLRVEALTVAGWEKEAATVQAITEMIPYEDVALAA